MSKISIVIVIVIVIVAVALGYYFIAKDEPTTKEELTTKEEAEGVYLPEAGSIKIEIPEANVEVAPGAGLDVPAYQNPYEEGSPTNPFSGTRTNPFGR